MERKGISDKELRELMGEGKIQPMPDYKSLRDEMAMAALAGLLACPEVQIHASTAKAAYQMADWMLAARESSSTV